AKRNLAKVALSVTTLDPKLARTMEPRASTPPKRLEAIKRLADAGIPTTVMVAPVIPALNDSEIERILDAAAHVADQGEDVAVAVRIVRHQPFAEEIADLERQPQQHVARLLGAGMRGGRDYDSQWGTRMKGTGPMAWMIGRRFEIACEKLGLNKRRTKLTTDHFAKPKRNGQQLSLF
ncbi:radical SAM protein, partial [Bradyrhizobium sp. WSM 1704]